MGRFSTLSKNYEYVKKTKDGGEGRLINIILITSQAIEIYKHYFTKKLPRTH